MTPDEEMPPQHDSTHSREEVNDTFLIDALLVLGLCLFAV